MAARAVVRSSVLAVAVSAVAVIASLGSIAGAATAPVGLGTAASFAVLAGSTVTNTGPTVLSGDLGVSPGTAITGFPPGTVNNGTTHAADGVAAQAQADATTAYNDAAGRTPFTTVTTDLVGQTLAPGVYRGSTLGLTGTVTLDGQNDPAAVFVFQSASTLITGSSSTVALIRGASACNVFWQVGSSATLGTDSRMVGTVVALTSVTATTRATVDGRLIARNGAVTLDTNTITRSTCAAAVASPTATASAAAPATATPSATPAASATPSTTPTATPSATARPSVTPSPTTSPAATTTPRSSAGPVAVPSPTNPVPVVTGVPGSTTGGGLVNVPQAPGTPTAVPQLPRTGFPIRGAAGTGGAALVGGALLLLAGRRRPSYDVARHVRR